MKRIKEILYDNMYEMEINGVALIGLLTASIYGLVYMIKDLFSLF